MIFAKLFLSIYRKDFVSLESIFFSDIKIKMFISLSLTYLLKSLPGVYMLPHGPVYQIVRDLYFFVLRSADTYLPLFRDTVARLG